MKRIIVILTAFLTVPVLASHAQTSPTESSRASHLASQSRTFFPRNWVRGYTDFSVAPSHNEPDLGRCMFPQPASAGGANFTCTALPRHPFIGYIGVQPLGLTPAAPLFP